MIGSLPFALFQAVPVVTWPSKYLAEVQRERLCNGQRCVRAAGLQGTSKGEGERARVGSTAAAAATDRDVTRVC